MGLTHSRITFIFLRPSSWYSEEVLITESEVDLVVNLLIEFCQFQGKTTFWRHEAQVVSRDKLGRGSKDRLFGLADHGARSLE